MKKFSKNKILAVASAAIMASSSIIAGASSNYGHSTDKWNAGYNLGIIQWNYIKQYSEFYCENDTHYASVKMRKKGRSNYDVFSASAKSGSWAKANSGWYAKDSDLDTRRSYYNHEHI